MKQEQKFRFYIDRKISVWLREFHEVEAKSYNEAEKIIKNMFTEGNTDDTFNEQEILFDTQEDMSVGENGGQPTMELYNYETSEMLLDNIKP
jgi:hypothetical protein